jgi:hypothetical protein
MSAHVNAAGGGTIVLRPVTYIVGAQRPSAGGKDRSFAGSDIIHLTQCSGPVSIQGNGARLRSAPGLRYGRFDPHSGNALADPEKLDLTNEAVPYKAMVHIENCSGSVSVSNLELDGNLQSLRIGGRSAKAGWQAGGTGLLLARNSGPERVSGVRSHHHPQDGLLVYPTLDRSGATIVSDTLCEYNGRQGCSISGGRNIQFERCAFRHTGSQLLRGNKPGDGVDIEAEMSAIRNLAFSDCEFSDNAGVGVGSLGDVADVRFSGCRMIGTTSWAAWPASPGMRFDNCTFVGSVIHAHGDADPARAAQFYGCTFTDDPSLSPTGQVFLAKNGQWIVGLMDPNPNVLFSHCHFRLVGDGVLPFSSKQVIYSDCDMSQRSPQPSSPRGTYLGTNTIRGNARLEGSLIRGSVSLNGRPVAGNA